MTTEERLENLERELTELRKCVRTQQLIIEDEGGQSRAVLLMDNDVPRPRLYDEKGQIRVGLTTDKDGPRLALTDGDGKHHSGLSVNKDESHLIIGQNAGSVMLGDYKDGRGLALFDENGNRAELSIAHGEPGLALSDNKGILRAGLSLAEGGSGLELYDEAGESRAALSVDKDGPVLSLLDSNGNVLWKGP